jgi:hypothetical protein
MIEFTIIIAVGSRCRVVFLNLNDRPMLKRELIRYVQKNSIHNFKLYKTNILLLYPISDILGGLMKLEWHFAPGKHKKLLKHILKVEIFTD